MSSGEPAGAVNAKTDTAAEAPPAEQRQAERASRRAERQARKQRLMEQRRLQRLQDAEARQEAERREREALLARAYENYLRVRDWARRASTGSRAESPLATAEQQMATALAPLWDASPEAIANLRFWSEQITGVRRADYDNPSMELVLRLKNAVATLRRHAGADLFVEESPLLGGFGIEWHRQSYNEDTVRFFKALVALQDGGVLGACRGQGPRRLVWEIGGGWGGFAFQFKTVCPNVTYLITAIPELLLASAVYLMTAFPAARCRFYGESAGAELWSGWEEVDFVFAPDSAVAELRPPAVHATLDLMSLGTSEVRVAFYVQRAFDLGSRYFFSQLPGPCFPEDVPPVWRAIARLYWLHQVPPPLDMSAFVVDAFDKAPVIDDYAQAVGWRRLRV